MRVHFNIDYGVYVPDLEGVDLPDLGAARTEATRALGDFILEMPQSLWLGEWVTLDATDTAGLLLFRLQLSTGKTASMH